MREGPDHRLSTDALSDEIRDLAAQVHATEALLAQKLGEFVSRPDWNPGDWKSPAHWVSLNCGYVSAEATALVRVAEKVDDMPAVMTHARAGEVSLGVAALAARVATPEIDSTLAEITSNTTPSQARRLVGQYRELRPKPPDPRPDHDDYFWRTWFDDHGNWRGNIKAPAEVGAILEEAYDAARRAGERDRPEGDDADEQSFAAPVPTSETLRRLGDLALDAARHQRLTRPGGESFTVTVLVDLATLLTGTLRVDSTCRFESGPDVTPDLVRRLAEEGNLEILWHREEVPLKLGRSFRLASRHQRRALRFRDGGCAVPGCAQTRFVHVHHVHHWENGGMTDLDNEVMLCSHHHRLVHHGGWTIRSGSDQTFAFFDGRGCEVGNRLVEHLRGPGRPPPGDRPATVPSDDPAGSPAGSHSFPRGEPVTAFAADVWMHALLTASADHTLAA